MAKFIDEKNLINNHVNSYIDRINEFSKYITGSPSFVTYYGKDLLKSTEDQGLNGVYETLGNESPIKYQKIENFPIFNFEEISPSIDFDEESGLDTDLEGSAIILPGTIKPFTDDRFIISYMDRRILFRISNVEMGNIANKVYYKISFYETSDDIKKLEEENLSEEYETLYDNVGKDEKIIVRKDVYSILEKLENNLESIRKKFISSFYHDKINSFLYGNSREYLYDNYLAIFIKNNNVFIKKNTFMYNFIIEPWIEGFTVNNIYDQTIFRAIETRDKVNLYKSFYYILSDITSLKAGSSPLLWSYHYRNCKIADYTFGNNDVDIEFSFCPGSPIDLFKQKNIEANPVFNKDFMENIFLNKLTDDNILENIIIMYLNKYDDKKLAIYINENINKVIVRSYEDFILIPILIYIIKDIYEIVKTKY